MKKRIDGKLLSQKSDEAKGIRTDEELAKHAGVSRDIIRKAETKNRSVRNLPTRLKASEPMKKSLLQKSEKAKLNS